MEEIPFSFNNEIWLIHPFIEVDMKERGFSHTYVETLDGEKCFTLFPVIDRTRRKVVGFEPRDMIDDGYVPTEEILPEEIFEAARPYAEELIPTYQMAFRRGKMTPYEDFMPLLKGQEVSRWATRIKRDTPEDRTELQMPRGLKLSYQISAVERFANGGSPPEPTR